MCVFVCYVYVCLLCSCVCSVLARAGVQRETRDFGVWRGRGLAVVGEGVVGGGFSGRFGGNRHRGGRGWRLESPGRPFFSLLSEGKRPEVSLYLPRAPSDSRPLLVGLARFRLFRRFPAGSDNGSLGGSLGGDNGTQQEKNAKTRRSPD